jgi:hypothetical protein
MTVQKETAVKRAIRKALIESGRVRLFPNPRGFDREYKRWYGLTDGAADLVGLLRCPHPPCNECCQGRACGRWVEFEVKRPVAGSRAMQSQLAHANVVRDDGGFYCFVRSPEEALDALTRAWRGERE